MNLEAWIEKNPVPTPCHIVDLGRLRRNLETLASVRRRTGCRVLQALKGFAMFSVFPLCRQYLQGVCASSPHEARLGREEFGLEVHAYAAAYSRADIAELVTLADTIVFNSFRQWRQFRPQVEAAGRAIDCGLRINPEYSEVHTALYDPCAPNSRLGIRREQFEGQDLSGIHGLHWHTMCEQNADTLERTLEVVEKKFGSLFHQMKWLNFGGGHHITRDDYRLDLLCALIDRVRQRYGVEVYLEPGEAVGLNTGVLVATVLDVVDNGLPIAILDTSATAHMPDVLEMPYRPQIIGAGLPGEKPCTFRLAGLSCLAGDVIGDYSFDRPLSVGDRLIFLDMAHYSMVKSTTFNGVRLPGIATFEPDTDTFRMVREFGYEDYKHRLS